MNIPRSFRATSTACLVVGSLLLAGPATAIGQAPVTPSDADAVASSTVAPETAVALPSFRITEWFDGEVRVQVSGEAGSIVRAYNERDVRVLNVIIPPSGVNERVIAVDSSAMNYLHGEIFFDGAFGYFETEIDLRGGAQPTDLVVVPWTGPTDPAVPIPVDPVDGDAVRVDGVERGIATVSFAGPLDGSYLVKSDRGYHLRSGLTTGDAQSVSFAVPLGEKTFYTLVRSGDGATNVDFEVDAPDAPVSIDRAWVGGTTEETLPTFTGSGTVGADISLFAADGTILGEGVVEADRTWSIVASEKLEAGRYADGRVVQTAADVESTAAFDFTVVAPQQAFGVTAPTTGGVLTGSVPVFTGTGMPDAQITITGSTGRLLGSATVSDGGDWTVRWNTSLLPARYAGGTVTHTVDGAVTAISPYDFTLRATAPTFSVGSPAPGGVVAPGAPIFTGEGVPGATIRITGSTGAFLGATTVGESGTWTLKWNKTLLPARYTGGKVAQTENGIETASTTYDFFVNAAAFGVTTPARGGVVPVGSPVFLGSGTPGAEIRITGSTGDVLGEAKVASNGVWTVRWNKSLLPARYTGGAITQSVGGDVTDATTYDFTVVR